MVRVTVGQIYEPPSAYGVGGGLPNVGLLGQDIHTSPKKLER